MCVQAPSDGFVLQNGLFSNEIVKSDRDQKVSLFLLSAVPLTPEFPVPVFYTPASGTSRIA